MVQDGLTHCLRREETEMEKVHQEDSVVTRKGHRDAAASQGDAGYRL